MVDRRNDQSRSRGQGEKVAKVCARPAWGKSLGSGVKAGQGLSAKVAARATGCPPAWAPSHRVPAPQARNNIFKNQTNHLIDYQVNHNIERNPSSCDSFNDQSNKRQPPRLTESVSPKNGELNTSAQTNNPGRIIERTSWPCLVLLSSSPNA